MSDSEKLDKIDKRIKRIEISTYIHIAILVLGFAGILSMKSLMKNISK